MTFLNVALLFGAVAFVVPLIIHLLNRSRFQVVPWAAMHLLDLSLPHNTRRWQWQSLLLLFVRCLIPVVLALCMARPLLTLWRGPQGNHPTGIALVLDNSYSMQAPPAPSETDATDATNSTPGGTALALAVNEARQLVEQAATGSQFALIEAASPPPPGLTPIDAARAALMSREQLSQRLAALDVRTAPVDLLRSLETAIACADAFRQPAASIVLLSDFRTADWDAVGDQALDALRQRLNERKVPIALTLMPFDAADVSNRSVHFVADQPTHARVGQPCEVRVVVRNDAHEACANVPVVARVDDTDLGTKRVDLPAGGQAEISFVCRFDRAGPHDFQVRVTDEAPIHGDDAATLHCIVLPTLKCLVVDGSPADRLLDRDSGFLQLALGARPAQGDSDARPFDVSVVREDQLTAESLHAADIVVLTSVPRLSDPWPAAIAERVEAGAHLLLFAGEALDRTWYAEAWGPGSLHPLLPCDWGALTQLDSSAPSVQVREQTWEHPALSFFNRQGNGQLGRIQIRQYVTLNSAPPITPVVARPGNTVARAAAVPIAWLSNGEPWLVSRAWGRGHVLQCATGCGGAWSNWPMRPSFVPAMQRLISSPFDSDEVVGTAQARESQLDKLPAARMEQVAAALGATLCTSADAYRQTQAERGAGRELWRFLLWALVALLVGEVLLQAYLSRGPR